MNAIQAGEWALVTGASSGLGAEFARQLAQQGSNLVLVARSEDKLETLASELSNRYAVQTRIVALDLAEASSWALLREKVEELCLEIALLVNNAGVGSVGAFSGLPLERELSMVRVNVEAPLALSQLFLPGMLERQRGGIITVASTVAFYPVPFMATYGASKAFVLSHTLALREELRPRGVRVMALCPGPVETGFQQAAGYETGWVERLAGLSAEQVVRGALAAYERDKALFVPGFFNSLQALLPRFVPLRVTSFLVGHAMRSLGRG